MSPADAEMRPVVQKIAEALTSRDGEPESWALSPEAKRGYGTDMVSSAGEIVNFQWTTAHVSQRLYIQGIDPLTTRTTGKSITVLAKRGTEVFAAEIARRLLPGYRATLADRRAKEAKAQAEFQARVDAVHQAEALFGACTDFGSFDPAERYGSAYQAEVRLPLRGRAYRAYGSGHQYAEEESGSVAVRDDGRLMDIDLKGIPVPVAVRMLRVLADYTKTIPAKAACCERYGSPHEGQRCEPDCPQRGADTLPEPKPFSAEFERLYDEWVFSGDFQRISWEAWLALRNVAY